MADRNVKVVLSLIASGYESGMAKAKASTDALAASTEELGKEQLSAEQQAAKAAKEAQGLAEKRKKALGDLGTMALASGAAILAGVGIATKAYADFDKQMSSVKATGSDAAASFDALRDAAIEAGSSTAFSASEAAQGIEELLKAGVTAKEVMGGGLKGALDLAAAGTLGVGEAAEIAATAMTQFGLSGNDVPHLADLLAAGAGKAQGEVTDLGAALKQSGLVASQFGLSIEETVGGLSAFAAAGLLGSDAGTSLKTMLQRLANPSKEAAREMESLGISAYDAQGNFVGLEGLAWQLESAMKGLTPEARNAAMAVIFGSDAVRAANVLYEQGASGIAGWTAAVNDQGYAAEVAATKLDNLAGDVEALGGAFESAFIRSGSGVNDFARIAVQGLTGFVNLISQIPAPVLATGTAIAGLAGAGLVGAGGFIKLVQTGAELRASLQTVREAFPKLDAAMGKVDWLKGTKGARAFGVALGALAVVGAAYTLGQVAHGLKEIGVNADEAAAAVRRFARSGDQSELDGMFRGLDTYLTPDLMGKVDGLGAALHTMAASTSGWGKMRGDIQGLLGMGGDIADTKVAFEQLDAALAGVDAATAADAFRLITEEAAGLGISTEQLAGMFPRYAAALRGAAGASGEAKTGAQLLAEVLDGTADSAQSATDKLLALGNAMLSLSGSQIGFEASLDAASEAINEHGKAVLDAAGNIDIGSEKGRQLKSALDDVAKSALSVIDGMVKASATTQEISEFQQRAAQDFLATADSMGISSDKSIELARDYGLIPRSVATAVTAPGAELSRQQTLDLITALGKVPGLTNAQILAPGARPSKDEVDALIARLGAVPGMTEAEIRTLADLYGVQRAEAALAAVKSKTVTISVAYKSIGGASRPVADGGMFAATSAGLVQQYADGGFHSTIGAQQPQIRPAGGAGIRWAEDGAGPWEAFISGHPAKRRRSRWLLEETARRLGGIVNWETAYADGDIHYASNYSPPVRTTSGASGSMRLHPSDLRALAGAIAERPVQVLPVVRDRDIAAAVREANRGVR